MRKLDSTEFSDANAAVTTVQNVTPDAAFTLVKQRAVSVLDLRTPTEFATGHVPGAVNLDFQAVDFESQLRSLDSAKPYIIHCAAGGRSTRSLPLFHKAGFKFIYHLDGGIKVWQNAKLPLEK